MWTSGITALVTLAASACPKPSRAILRWSSWICRTRSESHTSKALDNAVAIAGAESLFAACGKRLELNMQNNPVPPEKITQLGASLKEARERLHLTAFGGGPPGSAKGTLRPPRSREGTGGGGGGRSPAGRSPAQSTARSPALSASRSPALSTAQSPARSRASSFLPGISKEEIG
ncbi:SPBC4B4.04 [Symbiodinium sp. CCMP2592]|nr:SPBC4B4.04 [Symbiodinium sp. CCMP2592]